MLGECPILLVAPCYVSRTRYGPSLPERLFHGIPGTAELLGSFGKSSISVIQFFPAMTWSLKQPQPPQVISFPSTVAGWAASEPGQTLAIEPGAKPNCCWFQLGRAKSNRGQVSSAKLAVRC